MQILRIYYANELPRRHALTYDLTGANLNEITPKSTWIFWKTTNSVPGVRGYNATGVAEDMRRQGWSLLRYRSEACPEGELRGHRA
jgi:hypothetical protein